MGEFNGRRRGQRRELNGIEGGQRRELNGIVGGQRRELNGMVGGQRRELNGIVGGSRQSRRLLQQAVQLVQIKQLIVVPDRVLCTRYFVLQKYRTQFVYDYARTVHQPTGPTGQIWKYRINHTLGSQLTVSALCDLSQPWLPKFNLNNILNYS